MKKAGLLHPALCQVVASLGHGDRLVICDAGLPIPSSVLRIDLAFAPGQPPFLEVLRAILAEIAVTEITLARELKEQPRLSAFLGRVRQVVQSEGGPGEPAYNFIPHETFKAHLATVRAVIRTGEFTSYSNVMLTSGVVF